MTIVQCSCLLLYLMEWTFGAQFSSSDIEEWRNYKVRFNKIYETEDEDNRRMKIFLEKTKQVEHHNLMYFNGTRTFKKGINKFSDLTLTELVTKTKRLLGNSRPGAKSSSSNSVSLPDSVDWRLAGAVTGVKDQGECGACYAFAATGAVEAQHFLRTGKLVPFSEQQLIDCSKEFGNLGCHGGWVDLAFEYVKANNGIHTQQSYPFRGQEGGCLKKTSSPVMRIIGYADLPKGEESSLQAAVAFQGPVAVRIDAQDSFADYASAFSKKRCFKND